MARSVALTPHRQARARSMRKLADKIQAEHSGMSTHLHLRDAATQMERGNTEGTFRHLYAATHDLQPQTLFRHGHLTDDVHAAAKQNMTLVHREILKSRDIQDMEVRNQENIERLRNERMSTGDVPPAAPTAGAEMNAPGPVPVGLDKNVASGPKPPPPTTSQNHLANDADAIELVGPHGYEHGWIKVSDPSVPFGHGTKPGSYEHIAAIQELADKAASGPTGDPAHQSSVVSASLHNVARAVARRDIAQARVHMKAAAWGNKREADGAWTRELAELNKQLAHIPAGSTGFQSRQSTLPSASKKFQHPGSYVPTGDVPANPTRGATAQFVTANMSNPTELSAQTGALASTPHPFGKPGGPGLWGVKDMQLPPYIQNIAHALLRTGRAKNLSQAIAMARGATKRWLHGKNTSPEVRSASAATDADWKAKQAVAHAHSVTAADIREIYELACRLTAGEIAIELAITTPPGGSSGNNSPAQVQAAKQAQSQSYNGQPRVPAGQTGGGQFGAKGGPQSQQQGSGGGGGKNAKAKAALLAAAAADRKKAKALLAQIAALQAASKSATKKTASATKAGQTGQTASATPAKVSTTSTAQSSKTAPASGTKAPAKAPKPGSIAALRAEVKTLLADAAAKTAQAAKL